MARTVLGRGLSALIGNNNAGQNFETNFKLIPLSEISPNPGQPRNFIENDSFKELVASVKQHGILQPLVVQEKDERFEIIAGERRYRAAVSIGIDEVPAVVKKVKTEIEGFELALIENIQRQDLSPLEEAKAYRYLLDDCKVSQDKLAKQLGKSRSYIANSTRLLNLAEPVQQFIEEGKLSAGHARALVVLKVSEQLEMAKKIVNEGLSVRQVESLLGEQRGQKISIKFGSSINNGSDSYDDFAFLEEQMAKSLGAKVKVKSKSSKGSIQIFFSNYKELNKLKKKLL